MIKFTGIIAEYNPFHNGHKHQIEHLRSLGTGVIAVAMSGDFVQRGAPAWTDKYTRTQMALSQGADLVFELPTVYTLSSAEHFAFGGISLLNALHMDSVCFGCETPSLPLLDSAAELLQKEPDDYRQTLQQHLKSGASYPAAREAALRQSMPELPPDFLSGANNILALEYLKALRSTHSTMTPVPILRTDSGYHSTELSGETFSSASAIRFSYKDTDSLNDISHALPEEIMTLLKKRSGHLGMDTTDFDALLYYALRRAVQKGTLTHYGDIHEELANRIIKSLADYQTADTFILSLKRKNITYSRICRCLFQLLLEIPAEFVKGTSHPVPYLRLLGMRRQSSGYLRRITELPILTKMADAWDILSDSPYPYAKDFLSIDLFAADLYRQTLLQKNGTVIPDEDHAGIVIVD